MERIAAAVRHMWDFGHDPDASCYEPALAAALPLDKSQPPRAADALAAGRLIAGMLVGPKLKYYQRAN